MAKAKMMIRPIKAEDLRWSPPSSPSRDWLLIGSIMAVAGSEAWETIILAAVGNNQPC
jgi:hypothetical protein